MNKEMCKKFLQRLFSDVFSQIEDTDPVEE